MIKANKKQLYLAIIIIIILFSFSFFFLLGSFRKEESHNENELKIEFLNDGALYLNNTLPVSDKIGKSYDGYGVADGVQGYNEFSIENNSEIENEYEIYLVKNKVKEKEISEKFIKMYLTDHNNIPLDGFEKNLIPVFSNLVILNDKANGKLLYKGKINANSKLKFKLRIWVSDSYAISKENEQFSFSINVRAI